jgi:hypothetical protein
MADEEPQQEAYGEDEYEEEDEEGGEAAVRAARAGRRRRSRRSCAPLRPPPPPAPCAPPRPPPPAPRRACTPRGATAMRPHAQDLEAMKAKLAEMEAEAARLKQQQEEVGRGGRCWACAAGGSPQGTRPAPRTQSQPPMRPPHRARPPRPRLPQAAGGGASGGGAAPTAAAAAAPDGEQVAREEADGRSVYVGNVDYAVTPEELQLLFQVAGG